LSNAKDAAPTDGATPYGRRVEAPLTAGGRGDGERGQRTWRGQRGLDGSLAGNGGLFRPDGWAESGTPLGRAGGWAVFCGRAKDPRLFYLQRVETKENKRPIAGGVIRIERERGAWGLFLACRAS